MKEQTTEDYFKIAHSKANKQAQHPVYPQRDDYVQEAMVKLLEDDKAKGREGKSMKYSMQSTYHRQFLKEKKKSGLDLEDVLEPSHNPEDDILNKIEVQKFFDWLPNAHLKDMFYMKLSGEHMKDIGAKYGYSRQHMHNIMNRVYENYSKKND